MGKPDEGAFVRERVEPVERHDKKKAMTRRAFAGLSAAAAATLLVGTRFAWAAVGRGAWGDCGAVARPGATFGYDAGWSYSNNLCVWLAASCNCQVGRMTELFLEVRVDAYVACGGVWTPTWFPDIPDTPTYAYIRDESGEWLASAYWIIDTVYDHDYYEYMTGTKLRIPRREADYTCWCGADIRGLGGSAPGTHSVAEATQIVPHHVLGDDAWWHGRIVTLRPRVAEHLRLDVLGGSRENGAAVVGWSLTNLTNQHWIALQSGQGRTCFVPVHLGESPLYLDSSNGTWDDGAAVDIFEGNGTPAQSLYMHGLGNGYHLLVFECSGCALDLRDGGQQDGTPVDQWNSYNDWNNPNQQWKLGEPEFREEWPGTLEVTGEARPGGTLSAPNPAEACVPRNFPGTSGMFYRYTWYRGASAGERTEVVRPAEENPSYSVVDADAGTYLTCVITAHTRFADIQYKGEVVIPSVLVQGEPTDAEEPSSGVRFYVDGETTPCYSDKAASGAYTVPRAAWDAAAKPGCSGVEGWYRDAACTKRFADGSTVTGGLNLYARNRVALSYAMADRSCLVSSNRTYYVDRALERRLSSPGAVLPASAGLYYGDRVTFASGPSVWYREMGRVREAACEQGAYADASAAGPPMTSARLTRDTVAYLVWGTPAYDGISLA
ncbi:MULTISPECIES: RICIN domain-containing protein [Gordonibacter]|uniref:RICIN domain-containing protein n=1 Tax=Gordonibacter faecis TaxID=3047475 RepID=A0ABT7DQ45_9ACTN|nr:MULTISPECIES: RICIN domain-containing protein [unclassified Gordonibacter]MDJ1650285.1 RICIN domain-containing protein [Gordonibacter sp. KGMB12511]HIW76869.1 RICIN domain-containing protein [Candidatus Gordonibacter avicola]